MTPPPLPLYDTLARPSGAFAMVAVDARESMRAILRDAGVAHTDDALAQFKADVVDALAPAASAVLCDPLHGQAALAAMRSRHRDTGLIVAVDHFDEPRFGPLVESSFDDAALDPQIGLGGVAAFKLYLFWRPDGEPHFREDDARRFIDRCHELGVLALLEGVVRLPPGAPGFDDALISAARAMGRLAPDIYKTQVPTLGLQSDEAVERGALRVSEAVGGPWVILSNGVPPERFLDATAAACRGGASGALVGRALWRDSLSSEDPAADLASTGRARLEELGALVDRTARPWREALATR